MLDLNKLMQKFTVFTIIFSVIVVTIVAELVIQDYLEKVYPPAGSIQASAITGDEFEFFYPDEQDAESTDPETEQAEEEPEQESTNKVLEILEENRSDDQDEAEETPDDARESAEEEPDQFSLEAETSARIDTLLPALNIPNVEYKPGIYNGKLFNLVSTDSIAVKESVYGFFEVDGDNLGNFYEFEMKNTLLAESNFKKLKTLFEEFPEITANQTNQFGDTSFYINHASKVDLVYVVIQKDNFIYAFGYQSQFHETFKSFFGVLL
jgi:hypothetical protein